MTHEIARKKHLITSVDQRSPADASGIARGVYLVEINGEPVEDIIDYEQLTAADKLSVTTEDEAGKRSEIIIEKDVYEPLGLGFSSSLMSPVRTCRNHCLFCFIDQMPRGGRETLHFKDDDWRLSLIMGNYVTLTNVSDEEFERIVRRRVSPLYVSVHATDGAVRKTMMRNPSADLIAERLTRLKDENLRFHAQIVVCPGINDGDILKKTVEDLYSLSPGAQTVAVVPVGLTRFREGLAPLRGITPAEAVAIIDFVEAFSERARRETGEGFVYAADELYILAKRELPPFERYDDFPQLENGVGLLRKFEHEFREALVAMEPLPRRRRVTGATGASAAGFLKPLFGALAEYGIDFDLRPVRNDFFGHSVTVAGLVTAGDIAAQLKEESLGELLVIPDDMLKEREDVFLDGRDTAWLEKELGVRVLPLCAADGEQYIYGLFNGLKEV
jgi:putative radical SAM enzyme (TIGR03279 family)